MEQPSSQEPDKKFDQRNQIIMGNQINVNGEVRSSIDQLLNPVNPVPIELSRNNWQDKVVVEYDKLFGVDDILSNLRRKLVASDGAPIISIFGPGGIGKTTVAYELIKNHSRMAGFSQIAWVSVRGLFVTARGDERRNTDASYFWSGLLAELADQLDIQSLGGVPRASWEQLFAEEMAKMAKNKKALIVIDNLERASDTERVIEYFDRFNILKHHKLFVTTRVSSQTFSKFVSEYEVKPLSLEDTKLFIYHLGEGDSNFDSLNEQDLEDAYSITKGNPYLIRLIMRAIRSNRLPLSDAIINLKQSSNGLNQEADIFASSLHELQEIVGMDITRKLLSAFCAKGGASELFDGRELYEFSRIDGWEEYVSARTLACNLALIQASEGYKKFTIHSLLKEFICKPRNG